MEVVYSRPVRPPGWRSAGPFPIRGFTVLELMVSLAVLGILLAIAIPSYATLITSTRVSAQHNALAGDLALTRSEAVKRNRQVIICLSPDGAACGTGNAWDQGWMIFVDLDRDQARDPGEPVLRTQSALDAGTRLEYNAFGSNRYVAYQPTGMTKTNGTFSFCPGVAGHQRALILTKTGRVRTSKTKPDGTPLCGEPPPQPSP